MSITLYLIFLLAYVTSNRNLTILAGNVATIVIAPATAGIALILSALSLIQRKPSTTVAAGAVIACYLVIALKNTVIDSAMLAGFGFVIFQSSYLFNPHFVRQIEYNLLKRYTYLTFYPQMLCGPILKPKQFIGNGSSEITRRKKTDYGLTLFITGLTLKTLGANHLETWIDEYGAAFLNGIDYALFIYMDFAAWSMMACGISYCIDVRFPRNFKFPWRHLDASNFWRRWNTTLFTWVSEQVVTQKRRGTLPKYLVLLISTLTLGLWHGLKWNFLGFALAIFIWHFVGLRIKHKFIKFVWFVFAFNLTGALFYAEAPRFTFQIGAMLDLAFLTGISVFTAYELGGTRILYSLIRKHHTVKASCLVLAPWLALYDLNNPYFFYMHF